MERETHKANRNLLLEPLQTTDFCRGLPGNFLEDLGERHPFSAHAETRVSLCHRQGCCGHHGGDQHEHHEQKPETDTLVSGGPLW